ncbi:MAG TPA: GTP-binding protein [Acidimicrobiaceae bacterium]|nr:GTP-binding protein [Acidimicrobiaceae bacterium]
MDDHTSERVFACAKCGHKSCESGEIRTTGSGVSRFMNLQNHKFGYLACEACGYTEFYRMDGSGKLGTIFDVLTN